MAVRIAVLGAGIFSRDAYLPLLKSFGKEVEVVALWSRSLKTAEDTLAASPYAKDPKVVLGCGEKGLQEILNDPNIDAAISALPLHVALETSQKCWEAGKHILQEKPIARTVEEAIEAIKQYRSKPHPLWQFAENYRFEEVFLKAKNVKAQIGTVLKIDLTVNVPMNVANKYYSSDWRRDAENCPGGFVLEGCVHFVAGLRLVAHDLGCGEIEVVSGRAMNLLPQELPPMDTAIACFTFSSGICASFSTTYAAQQAKFHLSVVGTEGTMDICRLSAGYALTVTRSNKEVESIVQEHFSGLNDEVLQFISSVKMFKEGKVDMSEGAWRARPEEGARDLAVLEALFESSENSGQNTPVVSIRDPCNN